ncbi:unnamed protein product [Sphenostylis stenocarpa]|uniref:Pentatricopeptide repeat-containing protein n=1 Tax=Sphenostylis stenocarpa TaxID=92480 RepID=A0AA86SJA7_9FABA|nr:unnamed protein product [Sphenostylis stenocarpa]
MYPKCGAIDDALSIFENMAVWDVITWNTMISGYAQQHFDNVCVLQIPFQFRLLEDWTIPLHQHVLHQVRSARYLAEETKSKKQAEQKGLTTQSEEPTTVPILVERKHNAAVKSIKTSDLTHSAKRQS